MWISKRARRHVSLVLAAAAVSCLPGCRVDVDSTMDASNGDVDAAGHQGDASRDRGVQGDAGLEDDASEAPDAVHIDWPGNVASAEAPCPTSGVLYDHTWSGSGLVECQQGELRRVEPPSCASPLRPDYVCEAAEGFEQGCAVDADCAEGPGGYCLYEFDCRCRYGCESDGDCGDSSACYCRVPQARGDNWEIHPFSECVESGCAAPEDCGSGRCDFARTECNLNAGFRCRTAEDTCVKDQDCPAANEACLYDPAMGHWKCGLDGDCFSG